MEAVALSWRVVQGLSSNAHDFWPALQAFVRLAFHRAALDLIPEQAPMLTTTIQQVRRPRLGEDGDMDKEKNVVVEM